MTGWQVDMQATHTENLATRLAAPYSSPECLSHLCRDRPKAQLSGCNGVVAKHVAKQGFDTGKEFNAQDP